MDSEDDIKRGVVRLVTAPPRVLSRYEEQPRPYEAGWAQEEIKRRSAEREAAQCILLPHFSSLYDTNAVRQLHDGLEARKRFVNNKLRRQYPPER